LAITLIGRVPLPVAGPAAVTVRLAEPTAFEANVAVTVVGSDPTGKYTDVGETPEQLAFPVVEQERE